MSQKLRPDQEETVDGIREARRQGHTRILVQRPTGYGKTTIAAHIAKSVVDGGKTFAMFVHRKELMGQALERLQGEGIRTGLVGDGKDTDPDAPAQVISIPTLHARLRRGYTRPYFAVAVDDKQEVVVVLQRRPSPAAVSIVDECQHAGAATWQGVVDWLGGNLLIGVSATPWQPDGKPLPFFTHLLAGVAPADLIGPGLPLCDVRIFSGATPKLGSIAIRGSDFDDVELANAYAGLDADIVSTWWQKARTRRTICFASSTDHSKRLVEEWRKLNIVAEHIDYETPSKERERIIAAFRAGEVQVLSNYGLITEGFDVPAAACVVLARATRSESLFVQMVGRGLRATPDKDHLLLLDHGRNCLRFGHPLASREASLTLSRPKQRLTEKELDDGVVVEDGLRMCLKCFGLVPTKAKTCPLCDAQLVAPRLPKVNKKNRLVEWMRSDLRTAGDSEAKQIAKKREHWRSIKESSFRKQKTGAIFRAIHIYKDTHGVRPHEDPGVLDEAEKKTYYALISSATLTSKSKNDG